MSKSFIGDVIGDGPTKTWNDWFGGCIGVSKSVGEIFLKVSMKFSLEFVFTYGVLFVSMWTYCYLKNTLRVDPSVKNYPTGSFLLHILLFYIITNLSISFCNI